MTLLICAIGVFLISFAKGAFGGGLAVIGIPVLALVMDPLQAGAMLAPLFVAMDIVGLRYWKPATWSRPDVMVLTPALLIGLGLGTVLIGILNVHLLSIAIAALCLAFAIAWWRSGGRVVVRPRRTGFAWLVGTGAGITTMVAHAGGPPLAVYLLRLGLPKALYAGTMSIVFTVGNAAKVLPWLWVAPPTAQTWALVLWVLPTVPLGVWAGWRLHNRLDQRQLFGLAYVLLTLAALKLLWDGVTGLLV